MYLYWTHNWWKPNFTDQVWTIERSRSYFYQLIWPTRLETERSTETRWLVQNQRNLVERTWIHHKWVFSVKINWFTNNTSWKVSHLISNRFFQMRSRIPGFEDVVELDFPLEWNGASWTNHLMEGKSNMPPLRIIF